MSTIPASSEPQAKPVRADQPYLSRKARQRMLWLAVHRWLGIILLIPMAVLGVTGSAQVWPEETERLLNPQREVAASADPAAITDAHVAAAREALADYGPLVRIEMGEVGSPIIATSTPYAEPLHGIAGPVSRQAWVDPASARVIDDAATSGSFMWYMHFVHGLFLIPGIGRQIVGIMGLFLTISAVTGIYVFWPGVKRVLAALRFHKRDGKLLNLHRQSGFLLSIVLIIEAITGAWISFPGFFAMLVEPGVEQPERPRRGGGPQGTPIEVEDAAWISALDTARTAYPGRPTAIAAPTAESGAWTVSMAARGMQATVTMPLGGGEVTV
ncbi:MAG: PepSY domain-containing protein, partial [Novosphingobium sp.]|nr:PepSY domain-containing protein [Novosphingobium sp.]